MAPSAQLVTHSPQPSHFASSITTSWRIAIVAAPSVVARVCIRGGLYRPLSAV
jgi:hypothetical protein